MFVKATILKLGTMYFIDMTTSYPYTKLKGVWPVNFLHVVLYAHNVVGILRSQSFLFTLHTFLSAFSIILLKASTVPFA